MGENNEVVMDENNKISKNNKKIVFILVAVIALILAVVGIVNIVKPSPEKTVKEFLKNLDSKKISKAFEQIDPVGLKAFTKCKGEYKNFKDNYEECEEDKEDIEESMEEILEKLQDSIDDLDDFNVEIKEIKNAKKVSKAKNMYKVRVKIKTIAKDDEDTKRDNSSIDFYLYKKSGKYFIVGMDTKSGDGLGLF